MLETGGKLTDLSKYTVESQKKVIGKLGEKLGFDDCQVKRLYSNLEPVDVMPDPVAASLIESAREQRLNNHNRMEKTNYVSENENSDEAMPEKTGGLLSTFYKWSAGKINELFGSKGIEQRPNGRIAKEIPEYMGQINPHEIYKFSENFGWKPGVGYRALLNLGIVSGKFYRFDNDSLTEVDSDSPALKNALIENLPLTKKKKYSILEKAEGIINSYLLSEAY